MSNVSAFGVVNGKPFSDYQKLSEYVARAREDDDDADDPVDDVRVSVSLCLTFKNCPLPHPAALSWSVPEMATDPINKIELAPFIADFIAKMAQADPGRVNEYAKYLDDKDKKKLQRLIDAVKAGASAAAAGGPAMNGHGKKHGKKKH